MTGTSLTMDLGLRRPKRNNGSTAADLYCKPTILSDLIHYQDVPLLYRTDAGCLLSSSAISSPQEHCCYESIFQGASRDSQSGILGSDDIMESFTSLLADPQVRVSYISIMSTLPQKLK